MECCRLPIELCETVMNTLPYCYEFGPQLPPGYLPGNWETVHRQRALCACALTCRAWRVRAQYLLFTFPHIRNHASLAHLTMEVQEYPITGLTLGDYPIHSEHLDASKAGGLFMRSCLRLQHFQCLNVRFDRGPPLRLLRMRLTFFASITSLQLWGCTFRSFRAMMDVVWACPNLVMLEIYKAEVQTRFSSAAGIRQMSAAVENLRACQKLTSLRLNTDILLTTWHPTSAELSGVGRVFGCAVTELYLQRLISPFQDLLGALLRDSFPALRSVTLVSISGSSRFDEPFLHIIAVGRPIPGRLKTIVLQQTHGHENNPCCKGVVCMSEKVAGSEKRLPELLSGLAELTIGLDGCKDPERCARYIWTVLPGMRNALRFEYRSGWPEDWLPYTLLTTI